MTMASAQRGFVVTVAGDIDLQDCLLRRQLGHDGIEKKRYTLGWIKFGRNKNAKRPLLRQEPCASAGSGDGCGVNKIMERHSRGVGAKAADQIAPQQIRHKYGFVALQAAGDFAAVASHRGSAELTLQPVWLPGAAACAGNGFGIAADIVLPETRMDQAVATLIVTGLNKIGGAWDVMRNIR